MITIYGIHSPYVSRVRGTLLLKGLSFEHVSVNLGNRSDEWKSLSPVGTIPALKDSDGTVVCDSFHIALYLDEKYSSSHRLFGSNLKEKAHVLNALGVIDKIHQLNSPISTAKYAQILIDRGTPHRALLYTDEQKISALSDISTRLEKLQSLLISGKHFAPSFSFADVCALALLRSLESSGFSVPSFWKEWESARLSEGAISLMFAPADEKGAREI